VIGVVGLVRCLLMSSLLLLFSLRLCCRFSVFLMVCVVGLVRLLLILVMLLSVRLLGVLGGVLGCDFVWYVG